MSERTHSTPPISSMAPQGPATDRRRKLVLFAAGTGAVVLLGALAIQLFEPQDLPAPHMADAQEGKAHVAGTKRPLARVNEELVGWEVVAEECMARYGEEVLDNIINRTIIQQACQKQGVMVTAEEVDQEVLRIARKFKLDPDQWYKMLAAERNLTPIQYRRDVIWPMLALKKLAGDTVQVTREDQEELFLREYGERVKVRMILCDNSRRASDVWAECRRTPEQFAELAQKHSIDPISRSQGGLIPPIRRFSGNKELEEHAFNLRDGEISPVIQVGFGERWVILKCEGRTKPIVSSLQEVEQDLYEQALEEKVQQSVAKVFDQLKNQARIDNFMSGVTTGGVQQVAGAASNRGPVQAAGGQQPTGTYPRSATTPRRTATGPAPARQ